MNKEILLQFDKPFKEAIKFMSDKDIIQTNAWNDLKGKIHAKSFTIASITKLDMLQDSKNLLEESLKKGMAFETFQEKFLELISAKGWVLKPWRVETIYRTNMQSSFSAGRYAQQLRSTKLLPYWEYRATNDSRTRPDHMKLNGLIFRFDDPFWDSFYVPNGYNCRCRVVTVPTNEAPENKISTGKGNIETLTDKNGNTYASYKGIKTDLNWNYNPGESSFPIKKYDNDIQKIADNVLPDVKKVEPYQSPFKPKNFDDVAKGALPEKFFDVLGRDVPLKLGKQSYFVPFEVTINKSAKYIDRVAVHEYAHAYFRVNHKKSVDIFENIKTTILEEIKTMSNETLRIFGLGNGFEEYRKSLGNIDIFKFDDLMSEVADCLEASTYNKKNRLGWGHSVSYYKKMKIMNGDLSEIHSHSAEMYFLGNEYMDKYLPKTAELMRNYWKEIME